jgi:hypothetical protein
VARLAKLFILGSLSCPRAGGCCCEKWGCPRVSDTETWKTKQQATLALLAKAEKTLVDEIRLLGGEGCRIPKIIFCDGQLSIRNRVYSNKRVGAAEIMHDFQLKPRSMPLHSDQAIHSRKANSARQRGI